MSVIMIRSMSFDNKKVLGCKKMTRLAKDSMQFTGLSLVNTTQARAFILKPIACRLSKY